VDGGIDDLTDGAAGLISIGRMARVSGLTVKALRHYDRIDLLVPAEVDPDTGYRYYRADQIVAARLIQTLRAVDAPLEQVRACLGHPEDEIAIRDVLAVHRRRLQARVERLRGALHRTDHLLQEGIGSIMAEQKSGTAVASAATGDERQLAIDLFNGVWRLIEQEDRTREDDDRMLHMAHASRYHWGQVGTPANRGRGEWQCSRVYAILERPEPSLHHARRYLEICQEHGIADWDLAFAYEALARASAVEGDMEQARSWTEQALAAAEDIAEDGEREIVLADLETIPGQPRFW
jgi:DNA-binding transcriptional MerR regulator